MTQLLKIAGRIDDHANLVAAGATFAGDVTIDTGEVTFVNSVGMRQWMLLVRGLRGRGTVTFVNLADVLITQMNLFPEFAGANILSFYAQYVCPACGAETQALIDAVKHAQDLKWMVAPKLPCPECGKPMDLADFPERYLSLFKA